MDLETKERETKEVVGFLRQLRRIQQPFTAIGNLYFREDIYASNGAAHVVPMEDEKYIPGPTAMPHMFIGGRRLRVPRDLGPYDDAGHIATFTVIDSPGIIEALDEPHRSLDHPSPVSPPEFHVIPSRPLPGQHPCRPDNVRCHGYPRLLGARRYTAPLG